MGAFIKSCFLIVVAVIVISLSGCTIPYIGNGGDVQEGIMSAELTTELPRVKTDDYTNLDLIVGNPSNLEYYTQNSYHVYAKIINLGVFREDSDTDEQDFDMLGVKQKTFTWKLNTPSEEDNPVETPTTVAVQLKVEKEEVFTMPSILFATQDAIVAAEVRGQSIEEGPKTIYFQDNFISVTVDLNQQPPVAKESCLDGYVWANLKFTPIMGGTLNIDSVSLDEGDCEEIDDIAKTVQCKFDCETGSVTEKKFKLTVDYTYRLNLDQDFTIYPYKT